MTTQPTIPDWLTVGAKVAISTSRAGIETVSTGTVERILKASVVVDGARYRLPYLSRQWGGSWGPTATLHPLDDPQIVRARLDQARKYRSRRLADSVERWGSNPDATNEANLRDAIRHITVLLDAPAPTDAEENQP